MNLKSSNEYVRFFLKRFPTDYLKEILRTHFENERISYIEKEITEVVGMYFFIKPFIQKFKVKSLIDACAGYLLFSNFLARLHSNIKIYAIDKKELKKEQKLVFFENIEFINKDIREVEISADIAVGIHCCNELSEIIIEKFKDSKIISLMPCCIGSKNYEKWKNSFEHYFLSRICDEYIAWCYYLASLMKDRKIIVKRDEKIISERNILIAGLKI